MEDEEWEVEAICGEGASMDWMEYWWPVERDQKIRGEYNSMGIPVWNRRW